MSTLASKSNHNSITNNPSLPIPSNSTACLPDIPACSPYKPLLSAPSKEQESISKKNLTSSLTRSIRSYHKQHLPSKPPTTLSQSTILRLSSHYLMLPAPSKEKYLNNFTNTPLKIIIWKKFRLHQPLTDDKTPFSQNSGYLNITKWTSKNMHPIIVTLRNSFNSPPTIGLRPKPYTKSKTLHHHTPQTPTDTGVEIPKLTPLNRTDPPSLSTQAYEPSSQGRGYFWTTYIPPTGISYWERALTPLGPW